MLDFYVLSDGQEIPKYGTEFKLDYAGGIEPETFHRLQKQNVIDDHLDFYSDFRWSNIDVKKMLEKLNSTNTEHFAFKKILEKATRENSGLITVAD